MKKIFGVVLSVGVIFGATQALGNTQVTGFQCKSHLMPVTQLLNRNYAQAYYVINNEITNVLGKSLEEISQVKSENALVQKFISSAATTIQSCHSQCGSMVKCSNIGKKSILDINHKLKSIDDNAVAVVEERVEEPSSSENVDTKNSKDKVAKNKKAKDQELLDLAAKGLYPTKEECSVDRESELCKHYDWGDYNVEAEAKPNPSDDELLCIFDRECLQDLNAQEEEPEDSGYVSSEI